jgi:DNA-directed RNA polymerase specialized sigma24 family protein
MKKKINKGYNSKLTKKDMKDRVTLFDINPKTGERYLEIGHATAMIRHHILYYCNPVLMFSELEDACQDVLFVMATAQYKPKKSAPRTFATNIIRGRCNRILVKGHRARYSKDITDPKTGQKVRHSKSGLPLRVPIVPISDQTPITDDHSKEPMRVEDLHTDGISPESVLLAKELLEQLQRIPGLAERRRFLRAIGYGTQNLKVCQRSGSSGTVYHDQEYNEWDKLVGKADPSKK